MEDQSRIVVVLRVRYHHLVTSMNRTSSVPGPYPSQTEAGHSDRAAILPRSEAWTGASAILDAAKQGYDGGQND